MNLYYLTREIENVLDNCNQCRFLTSVMFSQECLQADFAPPAPERQKILAKRQDISGEQRTRSLTPLLTQQQLNEWCQDVEAPTICRRASGCGGGWRLVVLAVNDGGIFACAVEASCVHLILHQQLGDHFLVQKSELICRTTREATGKSDQTCNCRT